jgi:hypothetical protein
MTEFRATLQWIEDEEEKSRHGEGVSRAPAGAKTKEFRLVVKQAGTKPMTLIMRAESKRKAQQYAEARWPSAQVEVLG